MKLVKAKKLANRLAMSLVVVFQNVSINRNVEVKLHGVWRLKKPAIARRVRNVPRVDCFYHITIPAFCDWPMHQIRQEIEANFPNIIIIEQILNFTDRCYGFILKELDTQSELGIWLSQRNP